MKSIHVPRRMLAVSLLTLLPLALAAEPFVTNRVSVAFRLGFDVSVRFKGNTTALTGAAPRQTPNGDDYNYDDGYVLTDISDNFGGETWYWGYNDSASQIAGNTVLLSRTTPDASFSAPSQDDVMPGFEISYNRLLWARDRWHLGLELAGNYQTFDVRDSRTFSGRGTRVTDAYAFTPGTTPPTASPGAPYEGSFTGPGFSIGDTPAGSTTTTVSDAFTVTGSRQFDATMLGLRVGPYFDYSLSDDFNVWLSGGFALAWVDGEASWSETLTAPGTSGVSSGRGSHSEVLPGYYLSVNAAWHWSENWSAFGGVQYQSLSNYRHNFGDRSVEMDLKGKVFVTLGLSYQF